MKFPPLAVIAFTTLLYNLQPSRKRRAEPLPAKGGRPPLAFRNTAFRRSDTIKLPLNQPALWAEPEPPRASAPWRLEPGRRRRLNPLAFGNTAHLPYDNFHVFPRTGIYRPMSHHPQVPRFFAVAQNDECPAESRQQTADSRFYNLYSLSVYYIIIF